MWCMPRVMMSLTIVFVAAGACGSAESMIKTGPPIKYRVVVDASVLSPDGKRIAFVKHVLPRGAPIGYVEAGPKGGKVRTLYFSNDSCCSGLVWASARVLVFDDDYNVKTVDVTTGRVNTIAGFSNFAVSKDGRRVVGWADSGGHSPESVAVVSITGTDCHVIPRPKNEDDSQAYFSADGTRVVFSRQTFDFKLGFDRGPVRLRSVRLSDLAARSVSRAGC
jgi:hypothetical protein